MNEWNAARDHRERIYISYDSTNKNCQAGDIEMVEFGHVKDNKELPVYNYAIAYDTYNREPLFYEQYPGSIVEVSQLQYMLEKSMGYGYRHVGFILDRGYFSKENIQYMDSCGYDFVIMVKGMASFVRNLILANKGKFENSRDCSIREYKKPNFMTVPAALKELEKIEMVRQLDGKYRLDHAVTATQKTILGAFGMSSSDIKNKSIELSETISKCND